MPVKPMTTFFPAMVPAKNLRPLKTPTSVAGAAAARSFAPSVGYAERMRTRSLGDQAARTAGGKSAPAANPAASARWTRLATNRLADQVACQRYVSSRIEWRLHRSTTLDKTPFHSSRNPVQLILELTCMRSCAASRISKTRQWSASPPRAFVRIRRREAEKSGPKPRRVREVTELNKCDRG